MELARYGVRAGHARRELRDPEDEDSGLFYACDGSELVASPRLTDAQGLSARQIDQYGLAPFLAELEPQHLVVGERTTIRPTHRGDDVLRCLLDARRWSDARLGRPRGLRRCEPHLVPTYVAAGQGPYGHRNDQVASIGAEPHALLARQGLVRRTLRRRSAGVVAVSPLEV